MKLGRRRKKSQKTGLVSKVKALVGAFNQEKALVGAFSVIMKTDCETDGSFYSTSQQCNAQLFSGELEENKMGRQLLSRPCQVVRFLVQTVTKYIY